MAREWQEGFFGVLSGAAEWLANRLWYLLCTRQGSNLQPYDPKSYTGKHMEAIETNKSVVRNRWLEQQSSNKQILLL